MTEEIAEMIAKNIQEKLEEAKLKRENLLLEQHQIHNKAAWIDWWAEFQSACGNLETYTAEEKRELLDELVSEIRVYLTDEGEHRLTINFKVPIVRDTLTYADPSQKNLGYEVEKGSRSLPFGVRKTRNGRVWESRPKTKSLHRDGLRFNGGDEGNTKEDQHLSVL